MTVKEVLQALKEEKKQAFEEKLRTKAIEAIQTNCASGTMPDHLQNKLRKTVETALYEILTKYISDFFKHYYVEYDDYEYYLLRKKASSAPNFVFSKRFSSYED